MKIISLYLFLLGWTSAFTLHPWIPLPMLLGVVILGLASLLVLKREKIEGLSPKMVTLLYVFHLVLILSLVIQTFNFGFYMTGFTHMLSYVGVILVYFVGVMVAIRATRYPMEYIYKYISWGVVFVSVLTLAEFIGRNFLGLEFDFLRIGRENIATYSLGGVRLLRSRGTTVESGHLAMYLLMFSPFVYYYQMVVNKSKRKTAIGLSTILVAVITTFSAAGFVEIGVISLILFVLVLKKIIKKGYKHSQILLMYLLFSFATIFVMYFFYTGGTLSFLTGVFEKISLANFEIDDGDSRSARWYRAWQLFKESPLLGHGTGISSILYDSGSTSFYLELLVETGLIGLMVFLSIMGYHLKRIWLLQGTLKYIYLISFVTMAIHLAVISDYWYPWMWTLFSLVNIQYYRQKLPATEVAKEKEKRRKKHKLVWGRSNSH